MQFDLRSAIETLNSQGNVAFQIANGARPPAAYLFSSILPEERRNTYNVATGSMTVRTTAAGIVGMDSPYPEGGAVDSQAFNENTAKVANASKLPEQLLRELQNELLRLQVIGGNTTEAIINTALNWFNKIIVQAHLDTVEWMRGQALTLGKIDWTFNDKRLFVDYGIPAANFLTARTGNNGYGGSTSKFWTDIATARQKLKGAVRTMIMHSDTKEMILANSVNNIKLLSEDLSRGTFSIVQYKTVGGNTIESSDPRDRAAFVTYDDEMEVFDLANMGKTKTIPFMPKGVILAIGNFVNNRFIVGSGSTPPVPQNNLGYTHIAPTVEGGGASGRWGRIFVPQGEPWSIRAEGVTNCLPVIEAPERLIVLTTEMV